MRKPLFTALKITLFSFSLPLLFASNSWAKTCTEKEIETYISNKNRPALIDCGAKAVPKLLKALKTGGATGEFAAHALESIDTDGKTIVPELIEAFKSGTQKVRISAASALVAQAKEKEAKELVLPILIKALQDQDLEVRTQSAYVLRDLSSTAKAAVPALTDNLKHEYSLVRHGRGIPGKAFGTKISPGYFLRIRLSNAA